MATLRQVLYIADHVVSGAKECLSRRCRRLSLVGVWV